MPLRKYYSEHHIKNSGEKTKHYLSKTNKSAQLDPKEMFAHSFNLILNELYLNKNYTV
jgi:hypothetical protein